MASEQPIDFAGLAAALLDRIETLVPQWLPGGKRQGKEYVCADLSGGEGGSFSVCMTGENAGKWSDFATGDVGGDLTSLFAAIHNLPQGQAARRLMTDLGWHRSPPSQAPAQRRRAPEAGDDRPEPPPEGEEGAAPRPPAQGKAKSIWRPLIPVPATAKPCDFWHWHYQIADLERTWEYRFEGVLYGHVARFRTSDGGKEILPYTYCVDESDGRGTMRWHSKQWEEPRPLFVPATLLSGTPADVPVVLVEGEKCAQAGLELLGHEFDFVSWPGGGSAWAKAAWGWLMGRTVYMWPDADSKRVKLTAEERNAGVDPTTKPLIPAQKQPGMKAMVSIGSLLVAEYGCTVLMCPIPKPGEISDGWDIADAIEQGWDAPAVRAFIRGAHAFVPPDSAARAKAGEAVLTPSMASAGKGKGDEPDALLGWHRYLLTGKSGAIEKSRENVVVALDGRPDKGCPGIPGCEGLIRFNEFTNNVEKVRPAPWGTPAGDWLEADELLMGDWLVREHFLPSMPRGSLEEAVLIVARRHSFHPVRERMLALRGRWDHQKRLDMWLRRVCLEEDEWDEKDPLQQYLTLAGRWFIMGLCARVMPEKRIGPRIVVGPGTKFDYMLILEGPQGLGKSTLAATLGGEHFADTGLNIGEKDSYQNIQGILVYEWGELENMTKQEVSKVKLFVSSSMDRFRATFDRRPAKYPRQVVFVGTTNESHYLTDTTGNRRFWPVRTTRAPDSEWLLANLEQLFAEAVHRIDEGERFWPTREEQKALFDPQQQARTLPSSIEGAIRQLLYDEDQKVPHGQPNGALLNKISMTDMLARIGYTIDKQTDAVVKRASAVMHMLGWELKRSSQPGRPYFYVRPQHKPAAAEPGGSQTSTHQDAGAPPAGAEDDDCPF